MLKKTILIAALLASAGQAQSIDPKVEARIDRVLQATPLIDGHNDLPWEVRENHSYSVEGLAADTDKREKTMDTDIARLRAGRVGGQFWSVYIPVTITGDAALRATLEQIDIVKRLVARYPRDLEFATTAADVRRIHKAGRIASLVGMEGGHHIANSMAALRAMYALGARYMTITHSKNSDWADSATDDPVHNGLTPFGKDVIAEMNRIGMIVDLSHVSPKTMTDALGVSRAPVIFSHSSARGLNDHPRNVPDDVLRLVAAKGGVVMVTFVGNFLSPEYRAWSARRDVEASGYPGEPDRRKAALATWDKANAKPLVDARTVADHIEYIAKVAGHDAVGIGGDFDGTTDLPEGLGGVDGYPKIFAELIRRGWSDADLSKLAGGNVLRVMARVEAVSAEMRDVPPSMATLTAP